MGSIIKKGTFTTIRWGTTGVTQSASGEAAIAAILVRSIKWTRLGGEPILIEDNDGFTALWIGINDGDMVEFVCVDDTSITWMVFGDVLSLKKTGDASTKKFVVTDNDPDLERKREGLRTVKAQYFVNAVVT